MYPFSALCLAAAGGWMVQRSHTRLEQSETRMLRRAVPNLYAMCRPEPHNGSALFADAASDGGLFAAGLCSRESMETHL